MSTENEIHKASDQFYEALNRMANGDADSMEDIWSHSDTVTALHPIGGRSIGWDNVREPFQQVAQIATEGHIRLDDQMIQVAGDLAYEQATSVVRPYFQDTRLPWTIVSQTFIASMRAAGRSSITIQVFLRQCWMF